ncbi:hypothetical protein [Salinispira pacifica]
MTSEILKFVRVVFVIALTSPAALSAQSLGSGGDIPDSQQFVTYTSRAGGYSLEVPEGWARTQNAGNVHFSFQYDGLSVKLNPVSSAPDLASIRSKQISSIRSNATSVVVKNVAQVRINGSPVYLVKYDSRSVPNPVTNKSIRLENSAYFYYRNGTLAELRLWAPVGADNVDQWYRISRSFSWR